MNHSLEIPLPSERELRVALRWRISIQDAKELIDNVDGAQTNSMNVTNTYTKQIDVYYDFRTKTTDSSFSSIDSGCGMDRDSIQSRDLQYIFLGNSKHISNKHHCDHTLDVITWIFLTIFALFLILFLVWVMIKLLFIS